MTIKNVFIVLLASFAFTSAAFAAEPGYISYEYGMDIAAKPPRPAPLPDPDQGTTPAPQPPEQHDPAQSEILTIQVYKRLMNVAADLRVLADIDSSYRDYVLESVVVDVRGSAIGTSLDLVIDNRIEQTTANPYGRIVLFPRNNMAIDREIHSLLVGVRGVADVDRIEVNLRRSISRPNPPTADRVTVPVYVGQRIVGNGFINLQQFPELRRYENYKIFSMEVDAQSIYQQAFMELLVNGRPDGGSINLQPYPRMYPIYPINAQIGRDQLMLRCRGDQQIRQIVFRLQRAP